MRKGENENRRPDNGERKSLKIRLNAGEQDEYVELYELDTMDEWINGAYDEEGNAVVCDRCGGEMKWNPAMEVWFCTECEQEMDRPTYFDYIGAEPPGSECLTNCHENYPFCKKHCDRFAIDPDDPMLS